MNRVPVHKTHSTKVIKLRTTFKANLLTFIEKGAKEEVEEKYRNISRYYPRKIRALETMT